MFLNNNLSFRSTDKWQCLKLCWLHEEIADGTIEAHPSRKTECADIPDWDSLQCNKSSGLFYLLECNHQ